MTDKTREDFEAWIRKDGGDLSTFGYGLHRHYANRAVMGAWESYQAATQQSAARIAELEAEVQALRRDAERWLAMRQTLVGADFSPEMGGGPVVMFELHAKTVKAGSEGADEIADAAIEAERGGA